MPPFLPRKRLRSPSPPPGPSTSRAGGAAAGSAAKKPSTPRKPTLFDALDASAAPRTSAEQRRKLLAHLAGGDEGSDSALSSLSASGSGSESDELDFEDVPAPPPKRRRVAVAAAGDNDDDDDNEEEEEEDIEFEDVPTQTLAPARATAPGPSGDLELTLTRETRVSLVNPYNKKQGPSKIERGIRIATHCMHVQTLLWHNAVRNGWVCDGEVQRVLVGQLGPTVNAAVEKWRVDSGLDVKKKKKEVVVSRKGKAKANADVDAKGRKRDERSQRDWGEPAQRAEGVQVNLSGGDPLFRLLSLLSKYWRQRFRITAPGLRKTGYMSLPVLDEELKSFKEDSNDPERHGECIRNIEEFRARAKSCEGSRDLGAQLFVALLRGIGLDARMVVSLQPVGFGWSKSEEAEERKKKVDSSKTKEPESSEDTTSEESENEMPSTSKGKGKPKPKSSSKVKTKKTVRSRIGKGDKDAPIDLSDSEAEEDDDDDSVIDVTPVTPRRGPSKAYEKGLPPNYWTEVLSPVTNTYVPVDPLFIQGSVASNEKILEMFTPKGAKSEKAKQVMAYIVGFSTDGTAKDVTVRYLKRHMWPGKTKGFRIPVEKVPVYNRNGKVSRYEELDWFKTVMSGYTRRSNSRTEVDDHEEATDLQAVKPEKKEVKEGEETLQSYKSSVDFVLERHLRREEALLPGSKHVKIFTVKGKKGEPSTDEKVFRRKDVVPCKSIETWHKVGREPKVGEHPLKRVPYRAATTNRKRELAEAEALNGEKMLQGLYSEAQTDWIIPPPIVDGVIPKNAFGNMDVYTPSMVPVGAVHIPRRGTMRICKKLGIDYAEAVTGFEFGARMAIPIITGVVVAEENENMVLEQWRIAEAERLRKEDEKRTKAALGTWRKFLMGLRIVERVREEYGEHADDEVDELNPWVNKKTQVSRVDRMDDEANRRIMDQHEEDMAGGFFPEGHNEEEPAQSFFPTRQIDDDDEDGGGFIIEGHETVSSSKKGKGAAAYATPLSMQSNKAHEEPLSSGGDDEQAEEGSLAPTSGKRKLAVRSTPKQAPKAKTTVSARGKGKGKGKTPASKRAPLTNSTGKGRRQPVSHDDDDDEDPDEESSLSDIKVDTSSSDSEAEAPPPKSRRRATLPAKTQPQAQTPRRAVPKRGAARKSETAVRSHYFAHSSEDDDGDE